MATPRPASPVRLDFSQCIHDEKGNMYCPVMEETAAPPAAPAPAVIAPVHALVAPAPAVLAPAPVQAMVAAAPRYASDDNLPWPPPGMTDANCGCIIVKPAPQNAVALPRPRSLTNLSQYGSWNIDNGQSIMLNAMPQSAAYDNMGYFPDSNRNMIMTNGPGPMVTRPLPHVSPAPMLPMGPPRPMGPLRPMGSPGPMGPPKPMGPPMRMSGMEMDSRYPRKSVNMRRAIGFAVVMSCLCPPLGLVGLGTALRGRHYRHGDPTRAVRYRRASYSFSLMAVILIVLGVVVVVLLSQKYRYY